MDTRQRKGEEERNLEIVYRQSTVVKGTYPFLVHIGWGLNCNMRSRAAQHPSPMTRAANLRKITGLRLSAMGVSEKGKRTYPIEIFGWVS